MAYQIMKIAERLTNHGNPYGLYWTDLSYENLVVDDAGRVTVVDVENVVVVDRTAIQRGQQTATTYTIHVVSGIRSQ